MPDQPQTSVNVKSHEFNWIAGQDKLRAETIARLKKADFMLSDKFEFDEADHDTLSMLMQTEANTSADFPQEKSACSFLTTFNDST